MDPNYIGPSRATHKSEVFSKGRIILLIANFSGTSKDTSVSKKKRICYFIASHLRSSFDLPSEVTRLQTQKVMAFFGFCDIIDAQGASIRLIKLILVNIQVLKKLSFHY